MKTINLGKLGNKELDLTLEEYLIKQTSKDNRLDVKPNQIVLLNLVDRYFIGNIQLTNNNAYKYEKDYYDLNGYFIFSTALWKSNDTKIFIPTENNTIILTDLTIFYKIKNLIKQTLLFKNNTLPKIYQNTQICHRFINTYVIPREQYVMHLNETDKLYQNKQMTLREILKLKNEEYDNKFGSIIEEKDKEKEYLNKILFYESFDDKVLLPVKDRYFNCFNFTDNGFYKEIFIGIRDKAKYKIITNSTDEYNIKFNMDYIDKRINEINTLCKQCF